ncbi:ADP-ribose pyrophosphatase, mitochondrial [Contarinia nasturtii]|uniref:ADP-ribose pyrophosphatase, mitochondrial n=1 Tax=Contarinia nasturtii TaxID=265458 RepID=UPI0012D39BFB|nr:ADP-ribose pyrophosphatase, mitochondrial [Contarinia nasturtii]
MCNFVLLWQFVFLNQLKLNFCHQSISCSMKNTIVPFLHQTCRNAIYPRSNGVKRFTVPDNLVNWMEKYTEYKPEFYESSSLVGAPYADPAIDDTNFHPIWNSIDGKIDRTSFHGEYEIRDKYPLNVAGRTGVAGRGLLGRWGVNHAADPIVTKWKRSNDGTIVKHTTSGRNIVQMVAIQRRDTLEWAIPGGMVDAGEKATATLKREFIEEAMNSNKVQEIDRFFEKNGTEIYSGYVDDPRNTDNAWIETTAFNFHDDTGDTLKDIKFEAGDDAGSVRWLDLDRNIELYANHHDIVSKVAERLNAHW